MRPPIGYFGSKSRIADEIVRRLPRHGHYIEPFAGSLSVLLAKPQIPYETVNDLDGDLVNFWRVLRDRPDDLIRACTLTPHARAELAAAWDLEVDDDVERARRVWVILTQGRGGRLTRTGWRFDTGQTRAGTGGSSSGKFRSRLPVCAERLQSVVLECRPALDVIADYGQGAGNLLYVDPPYLGDVRGSDGRQYRVDMRGREEHRDLAAALRACRAAVVLSGYDSPLYRELFSDWHRAEITAITQQGTGRRNRVEVLWSNRPFAGSDQLPFKEAR